MSSSRVVKMEAFQIPFKEIKRATQNFSSKTVIGKGGFSWVYKGQLSEGGKNRTVAIKRLGHKDKEGNFVSKGITEDFNRECDFIFKFNHRNIIGFIGYCVEGTEMFIVYEFANKGSLEDHLENPEKRRCLTWVQRLNICLGAARALEYMHSGKEHDVVIHRDVKSGNILLGDNFEAKVCDFGFARSGHDNQAQLELFTNAAGTPAYMDPAYQTNGVLRKESDVYSFGVVLFEILSGTLANPPRNSDGSTPPNLINQVRRYHDVGLDKLTDEYIRDQIDKKYLDPHISDHITISSFYTLTKLAYQCISLAQEERPTMDEIVKTIEKAFHLYERNPALIEIVMKDMELGRRKPVAALTIYNHLVVHEYFEASVFNLLTQIIDVAIQKKEHSYDSMAYWSSNALALLFLTQQDIEFDDASSRKLKSYVEKLYGIIRDNLKKELDSALIKRIKDSEKYDRSSRPQPEYIVRCLNTLLSALEDNFVPPRISQQIIIQLISYINVRLFNSVLEYPECCEKTNAEDLKAALDEIKKWCSQYAIAAIEKLMHFEEIVGLLIKICELPRSRPPITHKDYVFRNLSLRQLEKIQSNCQKSPEIRIQLAAKHVISGIKRVMRQESQNEENNSFLLGDNSSESISIDDLLMVIWSAPESSAAILSEFPAFPFLYN